MARQSRVTRSRYVGTVENQGEARDLVKEPGDIAIVHRGRPRSLLINCPSGCGELQTVNLDTRVGPAWRVYRSRRGISVFPSIWKESGCESHFILWNDRVFWSSYDDDEFDLFESDSPLEGRILEILADGQPRHYADIAESLDDTPWSVLGICRRLVRQTSLHEDEGKRRGYFRAYRP